MNTVAFNLICIFSIVLRIGNAQNLQNSNYHYDLHGRLLTDYSQGIIEMKWNNQGKIVEVVHADTSTMADLVFKYNSFGQRTTKIVKPRSGNGLAPEKDWAYHYYIYNGAGKEIAHYNLSFSEITNGQYRESLLLSTWNLLEDNRVGNCEMQQPVAHRQFTGFMDAQGKLNITKDLGVKLEEVDSPMAVLRGNKRFDLTDHNNAIKTVVTDRIFVSEPKLGLNSKAELVHAQDYYPFGMLLADRKFGAINYPYGYAGMKSDHEMWGKGNSYNFGSRMYDPRLGKWLSVDPIFIKYPSTSPYVYALNSPISYFDPNGKEAIYTVNKNKVGGGTITISATIILIGDEINQDRVDMINDAYKKYYGSGSYKDEQGKAWTVNLDVKAVLGSDEDILRDLKPGENRLHMTRVKNIPTEYAVDDAQPSFVDGNMKEGVLYLEPEDTQELFTGKKNSAGISDMDVFTTLHETFHFLGISDRYVLRDAEDPAGSKAYNQKHTKATLEDERLGRTRGTLMGSSHIYTPLSFNIMDIHYENFGEYILEAYKNHYSRKGVIGSFVDRDSSGKLKRSIGPNGKGGTSPYQKVEIPLDPLDSRK